MINQVILVGRIGRDADLREYNNQARCAFSLATSYRRKSGEDVTTWHRVVLWGNSAETLSRYLLKGRQVYVQGSIDNREWVDKDGNNQKITEIKAQRCMLLGDRRSAAREPMPQHPPPVKSPQQVRDEATPLMDEDIPF